MAYFCVYSGKSLGRGNPHPRLQQSEVAHLGSILPFPSRLWQIMTARYFLPSIAALIAASLLANASRAEQPLTFEQHVRPILRAHCFQCHGEEDEHEGSLDLRLVRLMAKGGDSGPAIVPGKAEASLIVQRLTAGEMPPEGKGKPLS